jgi:DNA-binding response OmpR family regulator
VEKGLKEHGYTVSLANCGRAALETLEEGSPDLIILDLGLPDCDGVDLLQDLRRRGCEAPVIILTARDAIPEKVRGLDAGAEDYLVKPFAFPELLARLRALLRRSGRSGHTLVAGDVTIDLLTRHVTRSGETVDLSPREFDLLAYLARNAGEVVSREMLVKEVWRESSRQTSLDNVIDVHVSRLRRKINDNPGPSRLQVIRGVGIMLDKS